MYLAANIGIMIAFIGEWNRDYIKLFEEKVKGKEKKKYIIRTVTLFVLAFVAQLAVYHMLLGDTIDIEYFLRCGRLR